MYIQYVIIGFRPHNLPNIALQAQKTLRALVTICFTCCFMVSPLSNISPRHVTCVNNCTLLPNRRGSLMGPLFLSLVNGTIVILLGLTESLVLFHQFSSLFNAFCSTSETVLGNLPLISLSFQIQLSNTQPHLDPIAVRP